MHNLKRRIMGSLMAVLMSSSTILGTCPTPMFAVASNDATVETEVTADATSVDANQYGLVSVTEGNILHAWDWKFTDVTNSIEDIANAGYSVVQVSPCQVCEDLSTNNEWWKLYQPFDYKFGNNLGSEAEFKEMCATAEKYGVSIIVDVVANHMAGKGTDTSKGGSPDCGNRKDEVDPWWTDDKFHNTGIKFTGDYDEDREKMVTSNIGMPDVVTKREDVQERMISYLETMLDMGADGFRYDAAKHIGTTSDTGNSQDTFWKTISAAVAAKRPDALVYGEILNGLPKGVSDNWYVKDGIKVTESQKGWDMKDALKKSLSGATNESKPTTDAVAFKYVREASADKLITWVENHDTYLNYWGSTGLKGNANYMSDDQIMLGWSTVASRADTQALYFARPDGCSVPTDDKGNVIQNPGNDDSNTIEGNLGMSTKNFDWKDKKVAAVNKFKNAMVGVGETLSTEGNVAIIVRGNKGVVATNFGSSSASLNVSGLTGLKDGTYKDASGQNGEFTVSGGKVSGQIKANSFVVLYDADATPVETEVPKTIEPTETTEPTETPIAGAAKVSVSKDSGEFEEAFDVTVEVKDAEYAYYSYDGADWTEIKDGKATVTVGKDAKEVGDEFALYVKAKGKDGKTVDVEKTYTFAATTTSSVTTTAEPTTKGLKLRIPKADFASAPNVYFYSGTSTVGAGWPGTAMKLEGDYYVFEDETMTGSYDAIFNDGNGWQDPLKDQGSHKVSGFMEYSKSKAAVSEVKGEDVTVTTSVPATISPNAKKAGKAPEFTEPSTETPAPATETPTPATETPAVEVTETPTVVETPSISVDVADGSEFDTETMQVTVTVKNATNATYTIDDGVTKSFSDSTKVTLGEGKIADSDVSLKVTATDGKENIEKTYTYKKVFNPGKAAETQEVKISAIVKIQNAMEIVKDAAQANAATNDTLASQYGTNTAGLGAKKTISVDGEISDWDSSMLIAQGAANDDPRVYKDASMHELPVDLYALYGAYDDNNLYLMWEMTNVQDVVAPGENYPLSQGILFETQEFPFHILVDTGKSDTAIGNSGKTQTGGTIWDTGLTTSNSFNKWICFNAKGGNGPWVYGGDSTGVDSVAILGPKSTASNISVKFGKGILSKSVIGINDAYGTSYEVHNRVVGDVCDDSAAWADFNTLGHSSSSMDFHYEVSIPLDELGITGSDVENTGVGVLLVSTFGLSGMDCLPYDVSMNDNADQDDTKSQPGNSFEKSDEDHVTCSFARIGKGDINPQRTPGSGKTTPTPVETEDPDVTATPVETENPDVTATPVVTEEPGVTTPEPEVTEVPAEPDVTATPVVTEAPAVTETPAEPVKVEISQTDKMVVNFGADKSAPQMSGKDLTLEARPLNTTGTCQYQFAIDGELVQGYSEKSTYVWTADADVHTIQVSVKDEANQTVVVEKQYTVEGEVLQTKEPEATATTEPTVAPTATAPAKIDNNQKVPNAATTSSIAASLTVNPAKSAAVKSKVKLVPNVTGFKTSYTYSIVAKKSDGTVTQIAKNSNAASATWVPKEAGTYTLTLKVIDAEKNETSFDVPAYKITKLKLSSAKASKKTIKAGSKVKFTAKATNVYKSVKYQFVVKKGSKKIATRKYNKKATYIWTAKKTLKAGTYKCVITAKDSSGVKVSKTVSVKVKAKTKKTKK